jgi:hypothetical protein
MREFDAVRDRNLSEFCNSLVKTMCDYSLARCRRTTQAQPRRARDVNRAADLKRSPALVAATCYAFAVVPN